MWLLKWWKFSGKRFNVFVMFGAINTAVTYFIYLILSQIMFYQVAYFLAYVSGIILAYILNSFVFSSQSTFRKMILYPFIYVIQYLIGAVLMYLLLELLGLPNAIAPLLAMVLLAPISYYLNKKFLTN